MSLQDWLKFGWLREHAPSRREIVELFAIADRDIEASETAGLVADWQFNIAYNAALQLATAALAAAGYEAERASHHHRVLQSLEFTVGLDRAQIQKLDVFRKKRNVADYERAETISQFEVERIRELAIDLRRQVQNWIRRKHPDLAP